MFQKILKPIENETLVDLTDSQAIVDKYDKLRLHAQKNSVNLEFKRRVLLTKNCEKLFT